MKLSCELIRDLLPVYADGLASGKTAAAVEEHLQSCPSCRAELDAIRAEVAPPPAPQAGQLDYLKTIRRYGRRKAVQAAAAALALVALCAAFFFGSHWVSTVEAGDDKGLRRAVPRQFDRWGYRPEELTILAREQRGPYLAVLFQAEGGRCCMLQLDRDPVFPDRFRPAGGKPEFSPGELTSFNFGQYGNALIIVSGADLPEEVAAYSFQNSGVTYTRQLDGPNVLDVYVVLDSSSIGGHPQPLDEHGQPLDISLGG